MDSIAGILNEILSFIYYNTAEHYGLAIIILTLMVKIVTFPLNNKQIQSAKKMQELQPEIKKIQQKYKHDKEKQNQVLMEFMKKNNYNPMAGCLPLLVQFPILIGMFRLLNQPERLLERIPELNVFLIPGLESWGNLLKPDSIYILPVLAGATTFIYQRMTVNDPNQKMLMYMMPAIITFLSFTFPGGLILYWIMNNLFSMGQHYLVTQIGDLKKAEKMEEEKKSAVKGKSTAKNRPKELGKQGSKKSEQEEK